MSNSEHTKIGADFQKAVQQYFIKKYGSGFELEMQIKIGYSEDDQKEHKFDIVNPEQRIVIECKRYTWTETGNVPSAKIRAINEAAFYLSFLPDAYEKYIVMLRSQHKKKQETLAEYYYRTNHHLLGKTRIAEYDPTVPDSFRIIGSEEK